MKRAWQRGWTIIELLVAAGLGLALTLLASGLLLAASGNYRDHSEEMWLNDGGRYALDIMSQAIRQAGHVNWDGGEAPPELAGHEPAAIAGLDATSIGKAGDGISVLAPDVANGSDVLAVRFSGYGAGANGDGSSLNCAGFGVGAPSDVVERGWSIFYVATDAGGVAELRCKYRGAAGWGADAIVRGVDTFQVLYGLDSDEPADGVPNTFVNASAINAMDAALVLEGATPEELRRDLNRKTHWKHVCSVKLALLLHGEHNTRADMVARSFDLFGPAYADGHVDDIGARVGEAGLPEARRWRARRVFGTTVALRNRSG
nr:PilW family protein [uncultured Duganella sp.]